MGFELHRCNSHHFELRGATKNKLEAIRYLLSQPGVEDFEIVQPSLENIYSHFNQTEFEAQR